MKQSRKHSAIETITQTILGLGILFIVIPATITQNIIITAVFFIASLLRGYVVRRIFEKEK